MKLPEMFKSIMWSYDFEKIDPDTMESIVIINALKYGTLEHWRWVKNFYGENRIRSVLAIYQANDIQPKTRSLIEKIFNFNQWNYAPRGSK